MSKRIKNDHPFTDEEKAYLHSRSRDWEIEENDRRFGQEPTNVKELPLFAETELAGGEKKADAPKDEDDFSKYDKELVQQVQALNDQELDEHLKERGLPVTGNKEQKQLALVKKVSES